MHLREYIFRADMTHGQFAKLIGVSNTYLSLVMNAKKRMHPNKALKIEEVTKGMVTRDEALYPEKHKDWRIDLSNEN